MLSDEPTKLAWRQHPIYKYGVLLVLAFLATYYSQVLMTGVHESARVSSKMGLALVTTLLVNHVSVTFLRPSQQQRAMPFQMAAVVIGLGYVLMLFWQKYFQQ